MEEEDSPLKTASSLRWKILRRALYRRPPPDSDQQSERGIEYISRKAKKGFNLIPCHLMDRQIEANHDSYLNANHSISSREACVCYTLPGDNPSKLLLYQRMDNCADLDDFKICNTYDIDNTGLVCPWPSEEVLAYYCLSHVDKFRSRRVIELGSGYGLAGLAIAVATEALEVVISDGNPQVVDSFVMWQKIDNGWMAAEIYCEENAKERPTYLLCTSVLHVHYHNINANSGAFGGTNVKSMMLHWNQEDISDLCNNFDVIVASDCTFFKEFHKGLAQIIKCLLKQDRPSEAIFFSPKRGDSLDKFLVEVKESGLHFNVDEIYDTEVWRRHLGFIDRGDSWSNYEMDHCYPLLVRITL